MFSFGYKGNLLFPMISGERKEHSLDDRKLPPGNKPIEADVFGREI